MFDKENIKGKRDSNDQIEDAKTRHNIIVNGEEIEIEDYLAKLL